MTIHNYNDLKSAFIDWHTKHGYDTEYLFNADAGIHELLFNGESFENKDGSGTVYEFELYTASRVFKGWGKIYEHEIFNPESEKYETIGWSWDFP